MTDRKPSPDEVLAKWDNCSYEKGPYPDEQDDPIEALRTALEQTREAIRQRGALESLFEDVSQSRKHLTELLANVIKERNDARAALEEIAKAPHAGQGWCYEPHGTRPCSCHVADARRALQLSEQK